MFAYFLSIPGTGSSMSGAAGCHVLSRSLTVSSVPGMKGGLLFVPGEAEDRHLQSASTPALVVELWFDALADLELFAAWDGMTEWLALADIDSGPERIVTEQAMALRALPMRTRRSLEPEEAGFSYVVSYEGEAEDEIRWINHYLSSHVPLLSTLPGLRDGDVCTRVTWNSPMRAGWKRGAALLRNRVTFENAEALTAALHSPVRDELGRDSMRFPPFSGHAPHVPMHSYALA
ncbi:hypothetical protein ACMAUO_07035 [Gluconacetobacter sp. Hr-1-5]|uniref:hypothetical protein n=1 Tax=Gluconacetobacter sp. Hr-1-5 TaxID=3395370 RepID=UPI003B52089B